ncbi:hypothetical protein Phou_063020 [Phytohabitans houttuyneae]|uniref:Uncharacterized protein n=1 Tax=Phytohabitans houttuyneae TaxID=1076126 RepID=A0A6V8KA70_9ACTN|nr:hypothetical protein Phou_063020 [Phytohabitans houttuyneae]
MKFGVGPAQVHVVGSLPASDVGADVRFPNLGGSDVAPFAPGPLLSVRTAIVLLLALVVGLLSGGLSYLAEPSAPLAALYGGGAACGALLLFHKVVGA